MTQPNQKKLRNRRESALEPQFFIFPQKKKELAKEIRAALRDKEKYADWANSIQIKALSAEEEQTLKEPVQEIT